MTSKRNRVSVAGRMWTTTYQSGRCTLQEICNEGW